ncbi:MAG: phage tail tape measure protein [Variibacter sp.]
MPARRRGKALNQFGASALNDLTDNLADVAMNTKSVSAAFRDMANSIIRDLLRIAIRAQITGPLAGLMNGALGGLFGNVGDGGVNLGSRFNPLPGLGPEDYEFANGAAFQGGNVIPFARGGIVARPTLFKMASGAGLMGEAGPEAIMPLKRGPDGRLGVAGGAGGVSIVSNVHNYAGTPGVEQKVSRNADGSISIDTIIPQLENAMADRAQRGHGALLKTFGPTGRGFHGRG